MRFKAFKPLALAALCAFGAASAQAATVLSEGFDDLTTLSGAGWVIDNQSAPVGTTDWFQGNDTVFTAQAGVDTAYAAANYNSSDVGGTVSTWLVTPSFSTATDITVTLWTRADIQIGYTDSLAFGFSSGSSSPASFTMAAPVVIGGSWVQHSFSLSAAGAGTVGRFAIHYTGLADAANYVAVDTLTVTSVPEPGSAALLALGLAALGARRIRRPAAA